LVYQCLPSRYGFNPDDVRKADAIEIVIGQGSFVFCQGSVVSRALYFNIPDGHRRSSDKGFAMKRFF